jgi:hypothetical protein
VQVQVYDLGLEVDEEADEVLQAAAEAIDGPAGDNVELLPRYAAEQGVELRAVPPPLGAADADPPPLRSSPLGGGRPGKRMLSLSGGELACGRRQGPVHGRPACNSAGVGE